MSEQRIMVLISLRLWHCSFLQLSEITSVSLLFPSIHMERTDSPIKADNVLTMLHSSPSVFTVIDFMNLTLFVSINPSEVLLWFNHGLMRGQTHITLCGHKETFTISWRCSELLPSRRSQRDDETLATRQLKRLTREDTSTAKHSVFLLFSSTNI